MVDAQPAARSGAGIPILVYHSVSRQARPAYRRYAVTPDSLRRQLDALDAMGRTVVPLRAALRRGELAASAGRSVVLTFDDGLADFLTAFRILEERQLPATLFVATGYVGSTSRWLRPLGEGGRPMLSWPELRDLHRRGVEVGSHSISHRELDVLPSAELEREVAHSRVVLSDALGADVDLFAYPYGYHGPRVMAAVADAGYVAALGVKHAVSNAGESPLSLARVVVGGDTRVEDLADWLDRGALGPAPPSERVRTKAWRAWRTVRSTIRPAPVESAPHWRRS